MNWKVKNLTLKHIICYIIVTFFLLLMLLWEAFSFRILENKRMDEMFNHVISLIYGCIAVIILLILGKSKLFCPPQKLLFCLPALLVCLVNFPYYTYFFHDRSGLLHTQWGHWLLFVLSCLLTGTFEELLFRGVIFPILAQKFQQSKRGLMKAVVLSSVIFGGAHLLNLIYGAEINETILQVIYTSFIGATCAFLLIKTESILPCILFHALFNFCGDLLPTLGYGDWMYWENVIIMALPDVFAFFFTLYYFMDYKENERITLYEKIGFNRLQKRTKRKNTVE